MIPLSHILALSVILFGLGVAGFIIRRNVITIFMCIELMLNAVNLAFMAFSRQLGNLDGQLFVFFVIVVAAAEAAVGLAIIIALLSAWTFSHPEPEAGFFQHTYFTWIQSGSFRADFAFYYDRLTLVMTSTVTVVAFLIHLYSRGYMEHEGGYYRFFAYLNLFLFMMLTLVSAGNYPLMFVGWEGVGLCSYLLIGFYFTRKSAADAGKKAFIVTRIGDVGFTLGVALIFWTLGTVDFHEVFERVRSLPLGESPGTLTAICLLLFLGAVGKSAQLPLYVWLPDAMEGPTPVSALIHAATM